MSKQTRSFLMNVLNHPTFRAGKCDTGFIADNPELLNIAAREDKELKVLTFLGEKFVNGNRGAKPQFDVPVFPRIKQRFSGLHCQARSRSWMKRDLQVW